MIAIKRILVATDFSEASEQALDYGRTVAQQFNASLHVVHVVENLAMKTILADGFLSVLPELQRDLEAAARTRLDALIARLAAEGVRSEGHVVTSTATAEAIVTYAQEESVDLIVIGTHGLGGMSRFLLGSVAERVVRTARCPVLTIRVPDRDLPRKDRPAEASA
jgi:nucleotide-binding universal stress UspA family protein